MKQCPNCRTTYADDSLQFCLNDGANLIFAAVGGGAAETVQMPFGGSEPMRINVPPDSVPTIYAQSPVAQDQPAKKGFGLIIAGILGLLLLLTIAGFAAFMLLRRDDSKNTIAAAASPSPTVSQTATPTDETAKLKEEMANLKKQLEDQKNQKSNSPVETVSPPPPNRKNTTARVNSPGDGFLALRSEPNSESGYRIAMMSHGQTIQVLGCPKPSNVGKMSGRWCQVVYEGQTGWAFDAFMIF